MRTYIATALASLAGIALLAIHFDWFGGIDTGTVELVEVAEIEKSEPTPKFDPQITDKNESPPTITFSDGNAIEITWRRWPMGRFPTAPFAQHYDILREHAENGDAVSAFMLHGVLKMCSQAYTSEEDLSQAIDYLQQTHTLRMPNFKNPVRMGDPEQIPQTIEQMKRQYNDCSGLNTEQRSEANDWLRMAAENRLPVAMIEYGRQTSDPKDAIKWFQGAWQEGDAEGLLFMSRVQNQEYESGASPIEKVEAYASILAYTLIVEVGMGGPDHGPIAHRQAQRVQTMLADATKTMRQHELVSATIRAREIISSNSNCCFGM